MTGIWEAAARTRCLVRAAMLLACLHGGMALAEDGVTDSQIVLGQTVGLSGQIAGPVHEMNAGAAAYFSHINKKGGVNGRRIELRILDDKFDPALTAANGDILVKKERVFALFQSRGTPHTQALLALLTEQKVPLIAPSTGAAVFHEPPHRYVFNVRARYQDEVQRGVEQFATVGLKDIGILYVDDSFGQDGLAGFNRAMQKLQLTPAIVKSYNRAQPDVAGLVAALTHSPARALVVVGSAGPSADFVKALRAAGSAIQIMTLSNNAAQSFVDALGKDGAGVIISQVMPAPNLLSSVLGQEFKSIAISQGVPASYAAMEGFVAAKLTVEGLRRAGRNLTREGLVHALESMHRVDIGGIVLGYSEHNRSGSQFVELTMIGRDGKFVR